MKLSVVILAAGQGKRMKSRLPKVLQPLAGVPLLQHVIHTTRALHAERTYVVYGHGGDQVRAAMMHEPIEWVLQAEQKGTGHAVQQAMPGIPDDHWVLVLYGDVPLIAPSTLESLVARAKTDALAILSVHMQDPSGYGRVLRDSHGEVRAIVEERDANDAQRRIHEANTGFLAAPAARLREWLAALKADNAQGEYYLTDVIAAAVSEGAPVHALLAPTELEVLGVNDKAQLAQVEAGLRALRATALMKAGATLADPARIDIRGEVSLGADVFIDVNVLLEGRVVLGDGVSIGANCCVSNATLGARTRIKPHCVIDGAVLGEACEIGPFARLRPGTKLHAGVHIGNFVEVKNTEIEAGSKANHLSYLGDASLGKNVNVGAGTITCNYDGANKWPTVIEDGAFVGSGSMLVAPVRVGSGATIGAGSVITRAAPAGTLTLERSRQTAIDAWERPAKLDEAQKQKRVEQAMKKTES